MVDQSLNVAAKCLVSGENQKNTTRSKVDGEYQLIQPLHGV